ncbi:MAG: aldehyde dehydrogenase family protein, partial [Thermoplasmata archaeon]|nr:aldehyde dehydrogenase family protein [Thermoplasmata archaeon]
MGRTIDVINPATLQPVGQITVPDKEVIDASIKASAAAQGSWARTGWDRRQEFLITIADAIESEVDELSRLLTMEQGKPLAESVREIKAASQVFRHYASMDA